MRSLVLAACAGLLLVSGCSEGEAKPAPGPDLTSASPPASPSAKLRDLPPAAAEFTPDGAATFVSYYVSVLDYASKTGDTNELSRLSDPQCEGCNRYIERFRKLYESGGAARGRDWSQTGVSLKFQRDERFESIATIDLRITQGSVQLSSNDEPVVYPEVAERVTFALLFDAGWRVNQFVSGGAE